MWPNFFSKITAPYCTLSQMVIGISALKQSLSGLEQVKWYMSGWWARHAVCSHKTDLYVPWPPLLPWQARLGDSDLFSIIKAVYKCPLTLISLSQLFPQQCPNGAILCPNGAILCPNGAILCPNGAIPCPNKAIPCTDRAMLWPHWAIPCPNRAMYTLLQKSYALPLT